MLRAYRAIFMGAPKPEHSEWNTCLISRTRCAFRSFCSSPSTLVVGFFPNTVAAHAAPDLCAAGRVDTADDPDTRARNRRPRLGTDSPHGGGVRGQDWTSAFLRSRESSGLAAVLVRQLLSSRPRRPRLRPVFGVSTRPIRSRFSLNASRSVTTIFVLIMAIDYAPAIRMGVPGANPHAGLGEFFALPIFTCAGLMWMASAIDFVMIFVSLELVTMSFYVLVSFTRRSPAALEAGVKYLILSALSTGFLVYGITWIFGVTGETNLARIGSVLATAGYRRDSAALRDRARSCRARFQDRRRAVPDLGAGCLPGRADAGDGLSFRWLESRRLRRAAACARAFSRASAGRPTARRGRGAHLDLRKFRRAPADESEAAPRLLEHRARRLFAGRRRRVFRHRGRLLSRRLPAHDAALFRGHDHRREAAAANKSRITPASRNDRPFSPSRCLIGMISLAGIPFTAGFLGKFFIFDAAIRQHQTLLVVIGVITVGCGFYYYLKVVRAMYWLEPAGDASRDSNQRALARLTIILLIAGIFVLGIYPQPILNALNPPVTRTRNSLGAVRRQRGERSQCLALLHQLLHPTHCYALCAVARSGAHLLSSGIARDPSGGPAVAIFSRAARPINMRPVTVSTRREISPAMCAGWSGSAATSNPFSVFASTPGIWNDSSTGCATSSEFGSAEAR